MWSISNYDPRLLCMQICSCACSSLELIWLQSDTDMSLSLIRTLLCFVWKSHHSDRASLFPFLTAVSAQLEEKNTPCRPLNLLERFYERLFEILQVLKSCVFWNVVIFFLLWTSGPPFTTFTGSSSWTLVVVSKGSQHQGSPDETKDGHFPTWELWT